MNSKFSNQANIIKKNIAYGIIGGYAQGAAHGVVLSKKMSFKELGKDICVMDRPQAEAFDPLNINIDLENRNSSPDKMTYLRGLIEFSNDAIDDAKHKLNLIKGLSEDAKIRKLTDYAKTIYNKITKVSYGEGMVDDELKQDIRTIIETGKQKFIERNKEAMDQEAVNVEQTEGIQGPDQEMTPQEEIGMNPNFQEEPMEFGDDNNQFETQDLGFDAGFGDMNAGQDQADMGDAGNEMSKLAESFYEFNAEELFKPYAEQNTFKYGELTSTLSHTQVTNTVNKLLAYEEEMFSTVAKGEGVEFVNSDEYELRSKEALNTMAIILTTRETLRI